MTACKFSCNNITTKYERISLSTRMNKKVELGGTKKETAAHKFSLEYYQS